MPTIRAERESVTRHPLVSVLSSLQSHSTDLGRLGEAHLEPLSHIVVPSGPRPCTSLTGAEVEPAVSRPVGSVPVTGGFDGCVLDRTTFHSKRRDTFWFWYWKTYRKQIILIRLNLDSLNLMHSLNPHVLQYHCTQNMCRY